MGITASASARRVVRVLNFLAAHPEGSFTLSELARRLDLNKATCQSVLMALTEAGYVRRDAASRGYSLGAELVAVGEAALASLRVLDEARPELQRLANESGLECAAAMRAGTDIVVVAQAGSTGPFGPTLRVGQVIPLVPPFGVAYIAWSGPEEIETWLQRSPDALSDDERKRYREAAAAVRARGYSVTLDLAVREKFGEVVERLGREPLAAGARDERDRLIGELVHEDYVPGDLDPGRTYAISQVSAPVFGPDGQVTLVIGLYGFRLPLDASELARHTDTLLVTTRNLTQSICGRHPNVRSDD